MAITDLSIIGGMSYPVPLRPDPPFQSVVDQLDGRLCLRQMKTRQDYCEFRELIYLRPPPQ